MAARPNIPHVGLVVPRELVKRFKDALEEIGKLDKRRKITPFSEQEWGKEIIWDAGPVRKRYMLVPTSMQIDRNGGEKEADILWCLNSIGMQEHVGTVSLVVDTQAARRWVTGPSGTDLDSTNGDGWRRYVSDTREDTSSEQRIDIDMEDQPKNLLGQTINEWLRLLPQDARHDLEGDRGGLASTVTHLRGSKWNYMVYLPLLLLPATMFPTWSTMNASGKLSYHLSSLYSLICKNFNVTHIAVNAPIPVNAPSSASIIIPDDAQSSDQTNPNIFRSPTGLRPLHGDFGPSLPLAYTPTLSDFSRAFWCTARQNAIFQTWAPRYTMFSRGNVSEKARILGLDTLTEESLGVNPGETSAVDLYAGIGYFAFSYAKAGVGKTLCWEINPWSIEGLRRGAKGNKWGAKLIDLGADTGNEVKQGIEGEDRLLVFQESNEHAAEKITALSDAIPPVRHVNCGFLPSSKDSWETAVKVLDSGLGGWVHAHENIAKKDIDTRESEIVEIFTALVTNHCRRVPDVQWEVKCSHLERVKNYAPGVIHCVLDIAVTPIYTSL